MEWWDWIDKGEQEGFPHEQEERRYRMLQEMKEKEGR